MFFGHSLAIFCPFSEPKKAVWPFHYPLLYFWKHIFLSRNSSMHSSLYFLLHCFLLWEKNSHPGTSSPGQLEKWIGYICSLKWTYMTKWHVSSSPILRLASNFLSSISYFSLHCKRLAFRIVHIRCRCRCRCRCNVCKLHWIVRVVLSASYVKNSSNIVCQTKWFFEQNYFLEIIFAFPATKSVVPITRNGFTWYILILYMGYTFWNIWIRV